MNPENLDHQPAHDASTSDSIVEKNAHQFADPVNQQYPIDTRQHILNSWHEINQEVHASRYSKDEIRHIKDRIQHAARKIGFEIHGG